MLSARDFGELLAFDRISPIGDERFDYLVAQVQQTLEVLARGGGRSKPLREFLIEWRREAQTTEQAVAALQAWSAATFDEVQQCPP